jgi:hypothetical protein
MSDYAQRYAGEETKDGTALISNKPTAIEGVPGFRAALADFLTSCDTDGTLHTLARIEHALTTIDRRSQLKQLSRSKLIPFERFRVLTFFHAACM